MRVEVFVNEVVIKGFLIKGFIYFIIYTVIIEINIV